MDTKRKDFYTFSGINRDANPFVMKDEELWYCVNWYTHQFGAKKVRPGYTVFLDAPDNQPVRNLIPFNFPNGQKGIIRISNKNAYRYSFSGGTWGAAIDTYTVDKWTGNAIQAGVNGLYLHLTNGTDAYKTYSGSAFTTWATGTANKSRFITPWRSRIYADQNQIRFLQSAVGFDINYADPWNQSAADPATAGGIAVDDAGNGGAVVAMTTANDRVNVYRNNSVYRYTGQGMIRLPFDDVVVTGNSGTIAHYDLGGYDYFLSSKAIFKVDSRTCAPASFGINTLIEDTFNKQGITNPIPFSWGFMTGFYIGNIQFGSDVIPNGMFVHDERYDEWYVWSLGNAMTCFNTYYDPTTNAQTLISGDANGVTYIWGEQYGSDNGTPIGYRLRTKYFFFGSPETSNIGDRLSVSSNKADEASIMVAKDYNDAYQEIDVATGFIKKTYLNPVGIRDFNTLSVGIEGSTTTSRPEFYGVTIKAKDEQERYGSGSGTKQ